MQSGWPNAASMFSESMSRHLLSKEPAPKWRDALCVALRYLGRSYCVSSRRSVRVRVRPRLLPRLDEPGERERFASRVAAALAPGGLCLSLIGSTEGPPREVGPPRRSAREVTLAIEPALEIVELRSAAFREDAKAWFCLSRKRTVPAQASTRHD